MNKKHCKKCDLNRPLSDFSFNKSKKDGHQSTCKKCMSLYSSDWYKANKDLQLKRVKAVKLSYKQWYVDLLRTKKCVDCGEARLPTLQFDHRAGEDKLFIISAAAVAQRAKRDLLLEIDKCDVRCANCHAIKTATDYNWYIGTDEVQ